MSATVKFVAERGSGFAEWPALSNVKELKAWIHLPRWEADSLRFYRHKSEAVAGKWDHTDLQDEPTSEEGVLLVSFDSIGENDVLLVFGAPASEYYAAIQVIVRQVFESLHRRSEVRVVHWDPHGATGAAAEDIGIIRPPDLSMESLTRQLVLGRVFNPEVHELYYFEGDRIEKGAANRKLLDRDSWSDWMSADGILKYLPGIWIYPRAN